MTKEEFEALIKTLKEQMAEAAESQEFQRASMIRERIKELEDQMNVSEKIKNDVKPSADLMF
jgi:excinuclease UvrABC helicase subunit UvrB